MVARIQAGRVVVDREDLTGNQEHEHDESMMMECHGVTVATPQLTLGIAGGGSAELLAILPEAVR